MTKQNGIGSNSIFLTVFKLLTTIVGIVITMVLSKNLSLEQYGTYSQGTLIGTIGTSVLILGLSDAANFYFSTFENDEDKLGKYLSTILIIELFVGIIGFILIVSFQKLLCLYFDNNSLKNIIIWVAAVPMLTNFINIFQILFIASKKIKHIAIKNLIIAVLKIGIVCLTCFLVKNIVLIFALILLIDILQVLYFYISLRKMGFQLRFKNFQFNLVLEILKYSIPIALYVFLNALLKDVDKFFVGGVVNTEEFGIFSNVSKALPFDILSVSLLTIMIPAVTKNVINNNIENIEKLYKYYFIIAMLSTWTLGLSAIVCNKEMIIFLYGYKYLPGIRVFIIYLVADIFKIFNFYLIVSAKKKGLILALTSLVSLSINVGLDFLLFHYFGTIGVAIATLVVTILNNIVILIISKHFSHISLLKIVSWKFLLLFVLESLLLFTGLFFFVHWLESVDVHYVFILIIVFSISCLVLFASNFPFVKRSIKELNNF